MNRVSIKLFQDYLKKYDIERDYLYFFYTLGLDENIQHRISKMAEENGFRSIRWIEAGSVISTHAGPGAFGIAGLEK